MGKKKSAKGKEKKELARAEAQREAAMHAVIKAADAVPNPLDDFVPFKRFDRCGLQCEINFFRRADLTPDLENELFRILKDNMHQLYLDSWGWNDSQKRHELLDDDAKYLIAHSPDGKVHGFLYYRFHIEEWESLYVWELQLDAPAQRKGLGKRLMQLAELIARKAAMKWVVLTVFKDNDAAVNFYRMMNYAPHPTTVAELEEDAPHVVLGKCFDQELTANLAAREEENAAPKRMAAEAPPSSCCAANTCSD